MERLTSRRISPSEMVGFYRPDNRSRGVRDSLRLQALVWEADGGMGGLIVIDSLGFTVELSNVLRDRTAAALHTGRERIMVCFSHTHSAPNAAEEPDYFEWYAGRQIRLSGRPQEI